MEEDLGLHRRPKRWTRTNKCIGKNSGPPGRSGILNRASPKWGRAPRNRDGPGWWEIALFHFYLILLDLLKDIVKEIAKELLQEFLLVVSVWIISNPIIAFIFFMTFLFLIIRHFTRR